MILLSNGGTNIQRSAAPSETILIGTVDGIALLARTAQGWTVKHRAMRGVFVSGVTSLDDGTLFASTRGVGMARSDDGGIKWTWINDGLSHYELWSTRAGRLHGRDVVFAGALPAHLYISEDKGTSWRELKAFREAKSVSQWTFPPPPRVGHIKDIVIDGERLLAGVEIGSLQVSDDFGKSFVELPVDPDPQECDIHRILVHPDRPDRIIIANGLVGMMTSEDRGASWRKNPMPAGANYPDAVVIHPEQPDLLFMSAGVGWPPHWYELGRARGKIFRSRDAGQTWERLLGGLPNGQRALFSALTIEACQGSWSLHAVDTDGQVFESTDGGDTWTIIADVPPVSKADFYKGLIRDRVVLANVDDIVANPTATKRWQDAAKMLGQA
jgi:Sortilin, neurotensin receptor 3,